MSPPRRRRHRRHGRRVARAAVTTVAAALAAVLGTVAVSGSVKISPNPAGTNGIGTAGVPMRIVASIRNTSAATETIALARSTSPAQPGCPASVTAAPLAGSFPRAVEPGAQVQVAISTPGFTPAEVAAATGGAITCAFDAVESPAAGQPIQLVATFAVSTSGTPYDPQARSLDFVPAATTPEVQTVVVQNYGSSALPSLVATITNDADNRVTFDGGSAGCGGHACALPPVAPGAAFAVPVQCATGSAEISASIGWGVGSSTATQLIACGVAPASGPPGEQIVLATGNLTIVSTPGVVASEPMRVTSLPMGDDTLVFAALTGGDASAFALAGLCADPQTCDLSGAPIALPHELAITCTPPDTGVRDTMLTVRGASGSIATALVECDGNGAAMGPVLQVSTTTVVVPGGVPVGSPSAPVPITITNAGAGTLVARLAVTPPADEEWTASACTEAVPCSLVGHGSAATVAMTLTPAMHGDRGGAMTLTSNDPDRPAQPIGLVGTGLGGVLQVIAPANAVGSAGALRFGAIPASEASDIIVQLLDSGNAPLGVAIAPPSAPFAALPGMIDIAANSGTNMFVARCGPGDPFDGEGDFQLTSAAYNAPDIPLHASCTLVDTAITATPTRFDFGELRVGSAPVAKPFSIANPTGGDITITGLQIADAPSVLALALDGGGAPDAPHVLHANGTLTGTVTLTPAAAADATVAPLPDDVALAFSAGTSELALPITGEVVTPHAKVTPPALSLGTACVGSVVAGSVTMENDGTATLAMDSPSIDEAFIAHFVSPTTYPSPLVPGGEARVEVVPASTAVGTVHGVLTWPVDVPSGAFTVPVDLDYIDAGTAVSPRAHEFEARTAGTASERATVTIENCNPDPITVAVGGIVADTGDATAWDLEPAMETRTLLPHGTTKLLVRFVPPAAGSYAAHIAIATGDTETDVALTGTGLGTPPARTSFYACSCATSGRGTSPIAAWPLLLVGALLVRRRRQEHGLASPSGASPVRKRLR